MEEVLLTFLMKKKKKEKSKSLYIQS